jgi:hypothetical protein
MAMAPAKGRQAARSEDQGWRINPDNPWTVAQGVIPVIEARSADAVHTLQAGVIGSHL